MSVAKMAVPAADHQSTRNVQSQPGTTREISGASSTAATIESCNPVATLPTNTGAMWICEVMKYKIAKPRRRKMTKLEPGKKAPSFKLLDQDENTVQLKDFSGKKLLIYFYPKANTSG